MNYKHNTENALSSKKYLFLGYLFALIFPPLGFVFALVAYRKFRTGDAQWCMLVNLGTILLWCGFAYGMYSFVFDFVLGE